MTEKTKKDYIKDLEIGSLVAFKFFPNDAKMFSGKVSKIGRESLEITTKNGKKYFVRKENITWVNTIGRWPKGILECLKGLGPEIVEELKEDGEGKGEGSSINEGAGNQT